MYSARIVLSIFFVGFWIWRYGPLCSEFKLAHDVRKSFFEEKDLLKLVHWPSRDLLAQVENCFCLLLRYSWFLIWEFCERMFWEYFFAGKVTLDQWVCISSELISQGKQRGLAGCIDKMSSKLSWSKEFLCLNKDCFHWAVADWMPLLYFSAGWLMNYTCLPCQRWCLETMS